MWWFHGMETPTSWGSPCKILVLGLFSDRGLLAAYVRLFQYYIATCAVYRVLCVHGVPYPTDRANPVHTIFGQDLG